MPNYNIVNTRKYREEEDDRILAEEEARLNPKPPVQEEDDGPDDDIIPVTIEEQTWKKRYSDLQSYEAKQKREVQAELDRLREELEESKAAIKAANRKNANLPQSADEGTVFKWINDYPDVYSVVAAIVEDQITAAHEKTTKQLESKVSRLEMTQFEKDKQYAYDYVVSQFPDFGEVIQTDEFKEWIAYHKERKLAGNPLSGAIYDSLYVNETDGPAAAEAFGHYMSSKTPQRRRTKTDDAAEVATNVRSRAAPKAPAPNGNEKPKFKESDIENMTDREYERLGVDEAIREGRIIYDLSGAAR